MKHCKEQILYSVMIMPPPIGTVFHWKNYAFGDGATANKYFVVLGAKSGWNWIFAIATSKKKNKQYQPGCNEKDAYYYIPSGSENLFPRDTWLLLMDCKEVDPSKASKLLQNRTITASGVLSGAMIKAIRDCLSRCDDVSKRMLRLL